MISNGGRGTGRIVALAVLFEGGLAPLAWFVGWMMGRPAWLGFAWSARDAAIGALATLPMLALLLAGLRWPVGPIGRIGRFIDEEVRPLLGACSAAEFALIATAAGIGEELLFRGALQGGIARRFGTGAGLASASLLFGLLHPITPAYVVLAGLLGAYLGAIWAVNGNLLTVIVAHALYDFLALLILLRRPPAGPE